MAGHAVVKLVFTGTITQFQLAVFHRADAADDVGEHLVRGICLGLAVLGPVWHIIGIMGQQDQVVAIPHIQGFYDLLIKGLPDFPIFQPGVPKRHEQSVFVAVHHLVCGEYNVNQIFPLGSG